MIYFDNNATTNIAPEVFEAMIPFLTESFGNPSSAHSFGRDIRSNIGVAREQVASLLSARTADEIVFTSGGTESDNWAILGSLEIDSNKKHIVTTRVEHEAVRNLVEQLEKKGYEVSWLNVDQNGSIDLDELRKSLRKDTAICSVMLANNETGVLFPFEEIADVVKEYSDALFHVDGVNAAGKVAINLEKTNIDLFSISGHKFHAPKGIGALYIRQGVMMPSLSIGGGQENGKRAGTEAVHQIVGIGKAAELVADISAMKRVELLRNRFENFVLENIPNTKLNGDKINRLPNTSSISFVGFEGETILAKLNDLGICVSTGSACNAENHVSSAVLRAMEIPYETAKGTIRFSFGRYNTEQEIDFAIEVLPKIIEDLRKMLP
jgi:cysteine desulfurase